MPGLILLLPLFNIRHTKTCWRNFYKTTGKTGNTNASSQFKVQFGISMSIMGNLQLIRLWLISPYHP